MCHATVQDQTVCIQTSRPALRPILCCDRRVYSTPLAGCQKKDECAELLACECNDDLTRQSPYGNLPKKTKSKKNRAGKQTTGEIEYPARANETTSEAVTTPAKKIDKTTSSEPYRGVVAFP